ncbi:MAG: NAD(P)-dependent oxidoreductase [Candidatus Dormibacteria bacterium]
MKVTLFGATGGVGGQVLTQALAAGHEVTAVIRTSRTLPGRVRVLRVDLAAPDPAELQSAVRGADAVLSAVGAGFRSDQGIATVATRAIVQAMDAVGARRLVAISAAPVGTVAVPGRPKPPKHDPGDGIFMRYLMSPLIKAVVPKLYEDLAVMESTLADSDLEWTVIRPPQLTDKPLTGVYRTANGRNLRRGLRVSRSDLAHLMLSVADRPETYQQVIGVAH